MMRIHWLHWHLVLFGLVAAVPAAPAEAPPPGGDSSTVQVELGVDERVRTERWDDLADFNAAARDQQKQWRFRTRLWAKLEVGARAELMVLLNNESRKVTTPETPFKWDEVVFENLYLGYRLNRGWSLRVGRQDLMRGEGFVLFDGGPNDGSRTAYVNALNLTYAFGQAKLELLALSNPQRDAYLPRFNDRRRRLIDWDEQALGVYFTDQRAAGADVQAYFIHKTEGGDERSLTGPRRQRDRSLDTLGGRFVRELAPGWSVAAELAGQWGRQDPDVSIRAWGGYARLKRVFDAPAQPSLALAYIGMSGDDPQTQRNEAWDPLFSRWPKWSDLLIYSLAKERGVAYWSNIGIWEVELRAAPLSWLKLRATYDALRAFHPFPGDPAIFGVGDDRGDLYQVRADWKTAHGLSGHIVYERLRPGDFYVGRETAYFFRTEVLYALRLRPQRPAKRELT